MSLDRVPPHPHLRGHRHRRPHAGHRDVRSPRARRGRALVARGRVVGRRRGARCAQAIAAAAEWSARTVRPAGVLVALAATVGLGARASRSDGSSGWSPARSRCSCSSRACPFLFGARSYDVDLSLAHERIVAGDGVTGEIVVRNHGRPDRAARTHRHPRRRGPRRVRRAAAAPRPLRRAAARDPGPPPRDRDGRARRPRCAATRSACCAASTRSMTSTSCTSTRARRRCPRPAPGSSATSRAARPGAWSTPTCRSTPSASTRRATPGDRSTGSPRPRPGRLMVRQYEESRRSRMAVVLGVAEAEYADADEFELAVVVRRVARAARRARRPRRRDRDRVADPARRARAPARDHAHPGGIPAPDARRLQRRRAHREHDAGRRGVPAHRRVGRAALDRVRRRRLARQPHPAAAGGARLPGRHRPWSR